MALLLDFDGTVRGVITTPASAVSAEDAAWLGLLAGQDIQRALRAQYRHRADRDVLRARDLRCAVSLAQAAWCAALDARGARETPCRCLVGGGHVGRPLS